MIMALELLVRTPNGLQTLDQAIEGLKRDCINLAPHVYKNMPYLVVDCCNCNPEKLSKEFIEEYLDTLPTTIGMNKLSSPLMYEDDTKVQGIVNLMESHASIIAFPQKRFMVEVIFSCKPFDIKLAVNYLQDSFEPKSMEVILSYTGRELGE